jgi:branched-chain amino acid transport system substrate-binding protein
VRIASVLMSLFLFGSGVLAEELKIGTIAMLTGAYSTYGRQALQGAQLAIDEVNEKGGVNGRPVRLFVEDVGTYGLSQAATATRKLIDKDKVEVLLPLIIEDSEVVVPITSKVPLFTMALGCGARKCGFNVGKYHVRAPASHDLIIQKLMEFSRAQNVKRACIIAAEATYFEGYGRYIEQLSKEAGQEVVYSSVPLSNTDDQRSIAAQFRKNNCDAIFSWIPIGSLGPFFRRVREGGSKAQLFGIVETDDPQILSSAGPAAEGVVFARFNPGTGDFQSRYQAKFKELPTRPAAPSYDGVRILLELIGKVGTAPEALKSEFLKVHDREAVNGTIGFTIEGERIGEKVELMRIENGVPVEIK